VQQRFKQKVALIQAGTAFRDLKPDVPYYPTVGMKKPGETLRANFGQEPFAFDIDKMVAYEKETIQGEIDRTSAANKVAADETELIQKLIGQYLAHGGYVETARAFGEETIEEARALNDEDADIPYGETVEDLDALNRQSRSGITIQTSLTNSNRNPHGNSRRRHRQGAETHHCILSLGASG
jgi:hypothetical protein